MPLLQLFQKFPEFRNLLQQFKKSEVSTDNNFRDFNVMDQATGEVTKNYPDYDIDFEEDFKTVDAEKMVGGGIARPEQPIKGVKPIQVKGRKFQGIF
jgi:hypothetical protein